MMLLDLLFDITIRDRNKLVDQYFLTTVKTHSYQLLSGLGFIYLVVRFTYYPYIISLRPSFLQTNHIRSKIPTQKRTIEPGTKI